MRAWLLLAGSLLALFSTRPALGQSLPSSEPASCEEAAARFRDAETHYRVRDFEAALAGYQEAYRLCPRAGLLYNIGQCYRQLGRSQEAIEAYRAYLREDPETLRREKVEGFLAELEPQVAPPASEPSSAPASLRAPLSSPASGAAPEGGRSPALALALGLGGSLLQLPAASLGGKIAFGGAPPLRAGLGGLLLLGGLAAPSAGHLYAGAWRRAILCTGLRYAAVALPLAGLRLLQREPQVEEGVIIGGLAAVFGLSLYEVIDAPLLLRRAGQ